MKHRTHPYVPGTSVIDITAPGGVDALLAFHRATFGDAVMEVTGGDPGAAPPGDPAPSEGASAPSPPGAPAAPASAPAPAAPQPGEGLPDDPAALKALIADLRRENASSRTNAKATAAEEARTALVQELGKALGLVKDGDATPKPEELTAQLTAAHAAQRQAAVDLAVYQRAGTHQGDPTALLDSRAFQAKVADLDPTAEDFPTQVDAAIKAALDANPKLKAAPVAMRSSIPHAGGTGEGTKKPTSIEAAASAHYSGI